MPLNSIERRPAKASIAVKSRESEPESEAKGDELSLVLQAIGEAGMQEKEFALGGGLDPAQWSRIKGGVGNLNAKVLLRQPAKFWIALDRLVRAEKGISAETQEAMRAKQIDDTASALFQKLVDKLTARDE